MFGITQISQRLFQDGDGRHKPDNGMETAFVELAENGAQGSGGDECFAASRRYFYAHVRRFPDIVFVGLHRLAGEGCERGARMVEPESLECVGGIFGFLHIVHKALQVSQYLLLVGF